MDSFLLMLNHPLVFYSLVVVLALVIGSFLSMLSYRLPVMLFNTWRTECQAFLKKDVKAIPSKTPFNLFFPRSHCTHCSHTLTILDNIPLLGFIWQRGKCRHCKAKISLRYPLIELLTLILSSFIVYTFGLSIIAWSYLVLTWGLICITFIDIEHQIVPDELNFILLWLGLLLSIRPNFVNSQHAIIGVVVGYLGLWLIGHAYRLLRIPMPPPMMPKIAAANKIMGNSCQPTQAPNMAINL